MRAIAVLAVVFYHLGYRWMRGGFLGVDVFFVLSGYLITSLLVRERLESGRIHFAAFWTRRARRLFPALLLAVLLIAFAVRELTPVTEWPSRQQDLIWTIFYGANWHQIASDQDYFATWLTASPLRHMWSLAIEEQFYIVWPLIVAILLRAGLGWRVPTAIAAGIVVSVAIMFATYVPGNQSRAYFGTDARAHELLVGGLLAVAMTMIKSRRYFPANQIATVTAAAALGLIVCALVLLPDSASIYYRGGSLAFSVAVAVLLWAIEVHPMGIVARMLSLAVPRWLGQVSYGLYLWHWPAILFTPTLVDRLFGVHGVPVTGTTWVLNGVRVAVALVLTTVSYYAVEKPIRQGKLSHRLPTLRVGVIAPASGAVAALIVISLLSVPTDSLALVQKASQQCADTNLVCVLHQADARRPVVVLMGDSVAKSLDPAMIKFSQRHDWTYVAAAHNRCSVVQHWIADYDGSKSVQARRPGWDVCYDMVPQIQAAALARRPSLIVVVDQWLLVDSLDDAGRLLLAGTDAHAQDIERRLNSVTDQLTGTDSQLVLVHFLPGGQPIQCASPNPPYEYVRYCNLRASADTLSARYNALLDRVAARNPRRVKVLDLVDAVCPGDYCKPKVNGIWIRYDGLHFTVPAAEWLEPQIEQRLYSAGINLDV